MGNAKILVVDDEQNILDIVTAYLEKEGYDYRTVKDGRSALQSARQYDPDILVLDVMLPEMDGIELLTKLRRDSDVYVILLTAKTEETDKIVGLSVGADDYLTKPFSPRELMARIKAALRRMHGGLGPSEPSILAFRHLRIDVDGRQVWMDDEPVELTAMEFDLLHTLAKNPGIVLSREQILENVWGSDYYGEPRVVDVHIGHIRQKLGMEDLIATVRGVGYRFEDEPV